MPSQVIYLSYDLLEKLRTEENMSKLISDLLEGHFSSKDYEYRKKIEAIKEIEIKEKRIIDAAVRQVIQKEHDESKETQLSKEEKEAFGL